MTFWDFLSKLSASLKVFLSSFLGVCCIVILYLYRYMGDISQVSWYLVLLMAIGIAMIYGLMVVGWGLLFFGNYLMKGEPLEDQLMIISIAALGEAAVFAACAFLFIDSPTVFWMWFFGLQLYRLLFLGLASVIENWKKERRK